MGKKKQTGYLDTSYQKLFDKNRGWVEKMIANDPEYFQKLSRGQKPEILWIGCSDSRVPANEVTGTLPGEVFVHRNIANLCVHTDMNMLSVLDYAVNKLKVKHVIVAGHYDCGGISAALSGDHFGLIDNWLRHIKDVYRMHQKQIDGIDDQGEKRKKMVELNAMEQAYNLAKTSIVQKAWDQGLDLAIHAMVVDLDTGYLKDMNTTISSLSELDSMHKI